MRMRIAALAVLAAAAAAPVGAQRQGGPGAAAAPLSPRQAAPMDLTGTWVSLVTEDWRWRMATPPKNDAASIPLNAAGRKMADAWDLAADNAAGLQCRAYGAAGLMRQPTRVRMEWQDDATLKLETDAGTQMRLFRFGPPSAAAAERTWQGQSAAEWVKQPQSRGLGFGGGRGGGAAPFAGGNLKVVTTALRAGYLRKNGIPYSEHAVVTEYFNRHSGPGALEWFTVTTVVEDPAYLTMPFITSTSFRREADASRFRPTACETAPPTAPPLPAAGGPAA